MVMSVDLEQGIRVLLVSWMGAALVEYDGDLPAASGAVLDRIEREGLAMRVLREIGTDSLTKLWSTELRRQSPLEPRQRRELETEPEEAPPAVAPSEAMRTEVGRRRVDLAALNTEKAQLECLYQVRGQWLPLGQFSRSQCQTLQGEQIQQALQSRALALFFGRLADGMGEGERVRDRFNQEALTALYQESAA